MKKTLSNDKGMTLVEVLAALAITLIVTTIAISLIVTSSKQINMLQSETESYTSLTIAMRQIEDAIRSTSVIMKKSDQFNTFTIDQKKVYINAQHELLYGNELLSTDMKSLTVRQSDNLWTIQLQNSSNEIIETSIAIRSE